MAQRKVESGLGLALAAVALVIGVGCEAAPAADPGGAQCALIDTDFDIDDMMAIPLVIGNRHVAAIVTSEGYTKAEMGASALDRLIAEPGQRSIPVIVGAATNLPDAEIISTWGSFVLQYRMVMNRLNNFLATELPPSVPTNRDYVQQVVNAVADCHGIDVLIIGTFSSFVNYSPAIRSRIGQVVIMGKPLEGDPTQRPGNYSFNCEYDMPSCRKVFFEQLPGLRYAYVDVPRTACDTTPAATGCQGVVYGPNTAMVNGLASLGLPAAMKKVLLNNPDSWNIDGWPNATYGGKSLLWDQSASLYLVYPEIFAQVGGAGGHYETTLAPDEYRRWWTDGTNSAVTYQ
jgi:hypothetical protein